MSARPDRVTAQAWFRQFAKLPLVCFFLCFVSIATAQHSNPPLDENRATRDLVKDLNWSDVTKTAANEILAVEPAVSLQDLLIELMMDQDLRVRRDTLECIGRVEPSRKLRRQLAVLANRDPDPLCQARARLILTELSSHPQQHATESTSSSDTAATMVPSKAWMTSPSATRDPTASDPFSMETSDQPPISTADFQATDPFEPDSDTGPASRKGIFSVRKVWPTGFTPSELPPSPVSSKALFPEIRDEDDREFDDVSATVPGLLERPLTGPAEVFDNPIDPEAWPFFPLEAPLGYTGKSGILPTDVQEDAHFVPVTDRWRSGFPDWDRYGDGQPAGVDAPYRKGHWWDPYNLNVLKGDYPVVGQHTFLRITGQLNSLQEYRQLPTPATDFESTARAGEKHLFGNPNQYFTTNLFRLSVELFHGNTAFKPTDWSIRVTPVFDVNYLDTKELGIVNPDVRRGTTRFDNFMALEEYFIEAKLKDLSADYDFVSARVGSQQFTSDFRGFIFSDTNRAIRLFGTRLANRDQFNVAVFRQAEKDTNSLLNTFEDRNQNILIANYYRQDFIFPGYTAQFSVHYNNDGPALHYDTNDFLARPDPVGVASPHRVESAYLGMTGDGHIGRVNVTNAFYWVTGRDSLNPIAGDSQRINAQMAAGEISYDRDWIRFRASAFYASGDRNPYDHTATGFDSILDSPNFAGGQFSYWQRQQINLQGIGLVNRFSLIPDLRSSKFEGQSNFVNPGLRLLNIGADFELTPKTRLITNANYLQFDSVNVLRAFTFQNNIRRDIGVDLSAGLEYRPLLNDNIILTGGYACLLPGGGFRDLYGATSPFATSNTSSPTIGFLNSAFAQCILQF